MEEKLYEAKPYIYLALSFYALVISHSSLLMIVSGGLLFGTGIWVFRMRQQYRHYYREMAKLKSQYK